MSLKSVAAWLAVCAAVPALADPPGVYAIRGGTVHPVSGPAIADGIVVIRDGLVQAVGAGVAIPPDAEIVDAKGGDVYPGLIDAQTSLGFPAPAAPRGRRGAAARQTQAAPQLPETSAAFSAMREVKLSEDDVEARRATGVTTILTAPSFGIFNGQSVLLNLGEGDTAARVVIDPAAQQVSFNTRPAWTFPDSLMGVIADIRQTLLDAQHDSVAHAIYDKNPAGYRRPEDDPALQALGAVLRREVPVVFIADSDAMMRRAEAIAREFNLRYVLSGARQGYAMAPELKAANAPVLVSVQWPAASAKKEERANAKTLYDNGILFSIQSFDSRNARNLPYHAAMCAAFDLPKDMALKAITINPAQIFGVADRVGSLEVGKIANVIVTDGDPLEIVTHVKRLFIGGQDVSLETNQTLLYEKFLKRP